MNPSPPPAASVHKTNLVRRVSRPTVATNCNTLSLKNERNPYLKIRGSKKRRERRGRLKSSTYVCPPTLVRQGTNSYLSSANRVEIFYFVWSDPQNGNRGFSQKCGKTMEQQTITLNWVRNVYLVCKCNFIHKRAKKKAAKRRAFEPVDIFTHSYRRTNAAECNEGSRL